MNKIDLLYSQILNAKDKPYIKKIEILDKRRSFLKARIFFKEDLFIQIYRNNALSLTNMVLILENQRIYARDEIGGNWHRHLAGKTGKHDRSKEGRRGIDFVEFLEEAEKILMDLSLL